MIVRYYAATLLFAIALAAGCKKENADVFEDYSTYSPGVKTLNVEYIDQGEILFSAELLGKVEGDIQYAGFNYDTVPLDPFHKQVFSTVSEGKFSFILEGIKPLQKYYVTSFVANKYGLGKGKVVEFVVPLVPTPIPPCAPTPKSISVNGNPTIGVNTTHDSIVTPLFEYNVHAVFDTLELNFSFNKKPINGIYTITKPAQQHDTRRNASGYVTAGASEWPLVPGGKIYVAEQPDSSRVIIFCDIRVQTGSVQDTLAGHLILD